MSRSSLGQDRGSQPQGGLQTSVVSSQDPGQAERRVKDDARASGRFGPQRVPPAPSPRENPSASGGQSNSREERRQA